MTKRSILLFTLGLLLLAASSCDKQPIGRPGGEIRPQDGTTPSISSVQEAYSNGNLAQAERLANNLLNSNADRNSKLGAWRILALVSSAQERPQNALRALEGWRAADPAAPSANDWREIWTRTLGQLPHDEAVTQANKVMYDPSSPWQLKLEANLFILENRLRAGSLTGLPEELLRLYNETDDVNTRRSMEQRLFSQMHRVGPGSAQSLAAQVTEANEKYYPYALFRLEEARRLFLDERTQELAKEMVGFLKEDSQLADLSLFRTWSDPDMSALEGYYARSSSLGLVLPMTGQYGNLADKIVQGAQIACNGFAQNGHGVRLYVVDSDQPGWQQQLANLPPDVQIVGGPLRLSDYQSVKEANLTGQRRFFAFLRALDAGDEGRLAWRFFSNDADQVSAVLRFSQGLGISTYGAMIPEEDYGTRMLDIFRSEVQQQGGQLLAQANYPVRQHQEWNKLVAQFLHTNKDAEKAPNTPYRALFLPDSWQNAGIMMPHFLYYRENRLLFMGTMLWEQGITMQQRNDFRTHRLIIFPGAWDPETVGPSGMILRTAMASSGKEAPDFWVSLGYDFVSMAAALNLSSGTAPADVNRALGALGHVPWSGAPFSWDGNGLARQDLFVFTPADQGFTKADPAKFRTWVQRAWNLPAQPQASD